MWKESFGLGIIVFLLLGGVWKYLITLLLFGVMLLEFFQKMLWGIYLHICGEFYQVYADSVP